jgi:hypothetical protein
MPKRLFATLIILLLPGGAAAQAPMTLERLVAANTQARGGSAAIESVHALDLELEISEPGFTVTGHYRATRDGYMRIDIFADGERVYTEAVGPQGAWQMRQGETEGSPESEAGAATLRRGIIGNLYGLHELAALGYTLAFRGTRTIGGVDYWAIEKQAPDGFSETLLLDKASDLIACELDTSALHPDLDSGKDAFETRRLDYQPTAGVLFFRRSVKRKRSSGEIVQTVRVRSVAVNPALDEALFRRPQSSDPAPAGT